MAPPTTTATSPAGPWPAAPPSHQDNGSVPAVTPVTPPVHTCTCRSGPVGCCAARRTCCSRSMTAPPRRRRAASPPAAATTAPLRPVSSHRGQGGTGPRHWTRSHPSVARGQGGAARPAPAHWSVLPGHGHRVGAGARRLIHVVRSVLPGHCPGGGDPDELEFDRGAGRDTG